MPTNPNGLDDRFCADLSGLGYPGFAHIARFAVPPRPDVFLLEVLAQPDFDSRLAEGLPWLVHHWADRMDFDWMVAQARLLGIENRLGYLLEASGSRQPALRKAVEQLRRFVSPCEVAFSWESMPKAFRDWLHVNRSPLARRWRILTRLENEVQDLAA